MKCDACNKVITKKTPGLECRNCAKVVHASQLCSGLTAKQLSAIRNSDTLDWTCEECRRESPKRKSFVIPEEDGEEEEVMSSDELIMGNLNYQKFLKEIIAEMKNVLKKELMPLQTQMGFCCEKIDDLSKTVEIQQKRIVELEKKFTHMKNEKSHLELEVGGLRQYVNNVEQQRLENVIEVVGIPKVEGENLSEICAKLAESLKVDEREVSNIKRLAGRNGQYETIHMELKMSESAVMWVRASRNTPLLIERFLKNPPAPNTKVFTRRALTKTNKSLLWQAQQKLRPAYKHVWFQEGKVLLRKDDNTKVEVVRCEADIEKLCLTSTDNGLTQRR